MKSRIVLMLLLVAFAACGVFAQTSDNPSEKPANQADQTEVDSAAATTDSAAAAVKPEVAPKFIAYYFHSTRRCVSCKKIEAYSHEAVETGFATALESGELAWRMVNVDDEENQHFIDDYQLFTKSLVLVEMDGDKQVRWKNLDKVWTLLNDQEKFVSYVKDELTTFMGAEK